MDLKDPADHDYEADCLTALRIINNSDEGAARMLQRIKTLTQDEFHPALLLGACIGIVMAAKYGGSLYGTPDPDSDIEIH